MKRMKTTIAYTASILLLGLIAAPVWADEEPGNDVTMSVVSGPETDEVEFVDEIELPESAPETARDNARSGIETANDARTKASEDGQAFGESVSREAREQGRDAGNAANARDGAGADAADKRPVEVRQ